jgi:23S rRNA pseudouridine1911/1915/1917 synthase
MAREGFQSFRFVVPRADDGRRLDQVLAAHVPDLSRRKARTLLDIGGVFVDGARTKVAGRAVRAGQEIVANVGGALGRATAEVGKAARARDEAALPPFRVVFEDADLVVVDKPSGLLTAPTPESDRQNLLRALEEKLGGEVFLIHRLDLETSGLLVFARTDEANRALAALFREHDVERVYLAVLRGELAFEARTVELPLAGKRAVTHVEVAERLAGATLVRCRLETGRTHQIRLHAQHLGHPVLGDRRYGEPTKGVWGGGSWGSGPSGTAAGDPQRSPPIVTKLDPPRMALHATTLGVRHPRTGEVVRFESPWPEDLAAWLEGLRISAPAV